MRKIRDPSGRPRLYRDMKKGKSNIGKTWRKRLPETKGYIYTVHLDGKSATDTMSYQLSAH